MYKNICLYAKTKYFNKTLRGMLVLKDKNNLNFLKSNYVNRVATGF